jgi:TolA-binding protein
MTQQEQEQLIKSLQNQITDLKKEIDDMTKISYQQGLRLTNALHGIKIYYVADSSGGAVTRKLTFKDGILTYET